MSQKFRARAINASKQIPIYSGDEVPDLSECSSTPDMAAVFIGMEKEEQYEHHLLAKIFEGRVIPVPDVVKLEGVDYDEYNKMYPTVFAPPKQLIRMDPFGLDQEDVSNYDADDEDEMWINTKAKDLGITLYKFEHIIDKLENMSQYSIVTLAEAKVSLDENEELLTCIYDYWQSKRLKVQQPLIPTVPSTCSSSNTKNANPYVAFRRPFLNMQTRRNKKNDEKFYMRVLKIKRDLDGLLELLELVKKREMAKRDLAEITLRIFEKRFVAEDWSGEWINEVTNDQLSKPVSTADVPPKVNNDEGPFTFVRREGCSYVAPKPLNVRPQSPVMVFNGLYGRGNRFALHRSLMYDDETSACVNFNNFDPNSFHRSGKIYRGKGMQMIRPSVPFMYYLPVDAEDKKLNAYRFNDKELVLCSESNKADVENIFQEGLLDSIEDNTFSQSPDDSTEDVEMFDCEDMYASMEICDLFNNGVDDLFNPINDFARDEDREDDVVGCSTFKI